MLWSLRARSLSKAGKAFARSEPEGLHDLRVALRRVEATAAALGKKKIERKAALARALASPLRQLEVDRQLLSRLREMGRLPENAAAALEARWGADYAGTRREGVRRRARRKEPPPGAATAAPRRAAGRTTSRSGSEIERLRLESRLSPLRGRRRQAPAPLSHRGQARALPGRGPRGVRCPGARKPDRAREGAPGRARPLERHPSLPRAPERRPAGNRRREGSVISSWSSIA